MTRLYILVEGQTEEAFVNEVLTPHYAQISIFVTPMIVETSRGYKGGIVSYAKVKPQIERLCRQDRSAWITTLFDLYALPNDFPAKSSMHYPQQGTGAQLFVQPEKFSDWPNSQQIVKQLLNIAQSYETPEQINDSPQTAPSKRIKSLMPEYQKTFHGPLIAADIGLDALRRACPHFNAWLLKLELFSSP